MLSAAPMPDLTNVDTSSKDTNTCWFPTCSKQRFKEPNGRIHLYCGKTHADMARKANLKSNVFITVNKTGLRTYICAIKKLPS